MNERDTDAARLLDTQIEALARASLGGGPVSLIVIALVTVLLWEQVAQDRLLAWTGYMALVISTRHLHVLAYLRVAAHERDPAAFKNWSIAGAAAGGIGWGLACALLFPGLTVEHQVFLTAVIVGVNAASVIVYSPLTVASCHLAALSIAPLIVVHLLVGDSVHIGAAVLLLTYFAFLLRLSRLVRGVFQDAVDFHQCNERLIQELRASHQAMETVNEELRAEIATRSRTEAALIDAKEKAESATRAKSEFLATMSHEIRTPMNGVLGMTELLMNTKLTAKQCRFAETIKRSGEALLAIIDDILDLSRIEAGKLEIQHTVFDLRHLIEDTATFFAEQAQRKGIEITTVFPAHERAAYRGDPARIRQILINLIANAVKFTEQGEITVRVNTVGEEGDKAIIRVAVIDTGIGIVEQHQRHIFESFQQADGSTTRKFGGTGLGLAICNRLTGLMHGEMGVESEPGKGSSFWFTLKLTKMPESSISGQIRNAADIEGLRVLVVDDNGTNREALRQHLVAWNTRIETADCGDQALKMLNNAADDGQAFDLAILDRDLPHMDGVTLARMIKSDSAIRDTQLIMMSTVNQLAETGHWFMAGVEAYIEKPVRQVELFEAIASVMRAADKTGESIKPGSNRVHVPALGAHVLLAEDNPVNRELAQAMLQDLRCSVVLAINGREAVTAVTEPLRTRSQREYDVVLMDCQMPEMDGYQATRAIRDWERRQGSADPLPIVALTANALEDERQRCLAAGMSDYLAKPFSLEQLGNVIKGWVRFRAHTGAKRQDGGSDSPTDGGSPAASAVLDVAALDEIRGLQREGSPNILAKIIGMYLQNSPKLLEKLQEAAATGNSDLLRASAHSLKSSSANLGATRLAALCSELETVGRSNRLDRVVPVLGLLECEFECVCRALQEEANREAA